MNISEKQYQDDLLENVAAISESVWSENGLFYNRHQDELGGFPGVWHYCIKAARIFTNHEQRFAEVQGTKPVASYEYIDAITAYGDRIARATELPSDGVLSVWADAAIMAAKN